MRLPSRSLPCSVALLAAALMLSCGQTVPAGGVPKTEADGSEGKHGFVEASDLIPADLDLVMRVDLSKVRDSLGDDSSRELMDKALEDADPKGSLRDALEHAEVVWLGIRVADFEAGDRVTVVRSASEPRAPDSIAWKKVDSGHDTVEQFDARMPPRRGGTAQVLRVGKRDAVFITPVEQLSVARVLERGPDPQRGQPEARGLVSLDYRARRLSPALEMRFPSLARLISGVDRTSAIVNLVGGQLELDARIRCKHATAAAKVMRFLETIQAAGKQRERYTELLGALELDIADNTVNIHWPLPRDVVAGWIHDEVDDEPQLGPKPEPAKPDEDGSRDGSRDGRQDPSKE